MRPSVTIFCRKCLSTVSREVSDLGAEELRWPSADPCETCLANEEKRQRESKERQRAVRQVVMNELGLTRESIRQEVAAIVRETVVEMLVRDPELVRHVVTEYLDSRSTEICRRVAELLADRIAEAVRSEG